MTQKTLPHILTVSQLTQAIKSLLEPNFSRVRVQGEIFNLKCHSSGHIYFSLKDKESQISCVLFKGNANKLTKIPKSGDLVTLAGELSIYSPRGNYQLLVRDLSYSGIGELLLALHKRKEKLEKMGWFDPSKKKRLPKLPKRIGVVTSPTGAVIQDILNVLLRRFPKIHLILNPVKVQGEKAAEEIATAINEFNFHRLADVLIVGRGGGSLEDLWAYNEEIVAEAIFSSEIPIISAVGHETDYTIADFVADKRAPTPSAAAEIVTAERKELLLSLKRWERDKNKTLRYKIQKLNGRLSSLATNNFFTSPYHLLGNKAQFLDESRSSIFLSISRRLQEERFTLHQMEKKKESLAPRNRFSLLKERLFSLKRALISSWHFQKRVAEGKKELFSWKEYAKKTLSLISSKREKLFHLSSALKSIDPKNLLQRGYSLLFSEKDGSIILSTKKVSVDQKIIVHLNDGRIKVTANEVINE